MESEKWKEIDVTDLRCVICGEKVQVTANISQYAEFSKKGKKEAIWDGDIYTYFSCPKHGAVGAILNGKYYEKPSDLFTGDYITVDGVKYKRVEEVPEDA